MANTTNRNTSPTCTKRSLNARLMSRLRIPSIPSSRMCPPSRIGIGSRLRIPRFTLISTISEMIASGPFRAACPAAREIPTGPCSCFSETRPLNNLPTIVAVSLIFSTVTRVAYRAPSGKATRLYAVSSCVAPPLDFLPVDCGDQIIFFQSRALRRVSRCYIFQKRADRRITQQSFEQSLRLVKLLLFDWLDDAPPGASAFHFHRKLAVRRDFAQNLLGLLPSRILLAIQSDNRVAGVQASRCRGRVRRHAHNLQRFVLIRGIRNSNRHEIYGQQQNRENQVHERAGKRNDRALPPRLAHQLVWRAFHQRLQLRIRCVRLLVFSFSRYRSAMRGIDVRRILSRHAHVAAQRQRAYAIIRRSPLPPKQPRPESDGEYVHAHAENPRCDEVSPLVHQNHHSQHERNTE